MKKILFNYHTHSGLRFIEDSIKEAFENNNCQVEIFDDYGVARALAENLDEKIKSNFSAEDLLNFAKVVAQKKISAIVKEKKIDLFFFLNGEWLVEPLFKELKETKVKIAGWMIDDPYISDSALKIAPRYDFIFTVEKNMRDIYKKEIQKEAVFLPLGINPRLHHKISPVPEEFQSDLCHIGLPFPDSRRAEIIKKILQEFPNEKIKIIGSAWGYTWQEILENEIDPQKMKEAVEDRWVPLEEFVKYASGAKIFLNLHRDDHQLKGFSYNTRQIQSRSPAEKVFTVAGCGAFQLVDNSRPHLADFFEIGREIITFSDFADLKEKIRYYLAHPEERQAIADRAFQKVHAEHTYDLRIKKIINVCFG